MLRNGIFKGYHSDSGGLPAVLQQGNILSRVRT